MRKVYERMLKTMFRKQIICKRKEMKLTQAQMSENLEMSVRSYCDLENGKYKCSAITLVLYLIYCCDDVNSFLNGLKSEFEKASEDAAYEEI